MDEERVDRAATPPEDSSGVPEELPERCERETANKNRCLPHGTGDRGGLGPNSDIAGDRQPVRPDGGRRRSVEAVPGRPTRGAGSALSRVWNVPSGGCPADRARRAQAAEFSPGRASCGPVRWPALDPPCLLFPASPGQRTSLPGLASCGHVEPHPDWPRSPCPPRLRSHPYP